MSSRLRIAEFNVENLFIFIDRLKNQPLKKLTEAEWQSLSTSTIPNKPLAKVLGLAKVISELKPEILMLCEVGGLESLSNFNFHFLNNEYSPLLIEGNSERGIDIGYLVSKKLPFQYDLRSHRNRSINFHSHKFSRDVLEVRVFRQNAQEPFLILLLVHLKSKWDREGMDPDGRERRHAELKTLVQIYNEIKSEFSGCVPVIVGGDLNGRAARSGTDEEFREIYEQTDLLDCLEIAARKPEERCTQVLFPPVGRPRLEQLDYIFLPLAMQSRVIVNETFVYRFKDELGQSYALPSSLQVKRELPSDHYPVIVTIEID